MDHPRLSDALVVKEPDQIRARLAELGVTPEVLRDAVITGELGRSTVTEYHPKSAGGFNGWADVVAALRESLVPGGDDWQPLDRDVPMVVNERLAVRIAVTAGDEMTGIDGERSARTKNKKGSIVAAQVDLNLNLPFVEDRFRPNANTPKWSTWFLLIHSTFKVGSPTPHMVYYELSLPKGFDKDKHISQWLERLIFPPLNMEEVIGEEAAEDLEESIANVTIKRRK